ncbi:MAG: glycosyltransferase [Pirellulales bacterium]
MDVFIPVFDEPIHLVEKALRAAQSMRGQHETYLLDDGRRQACQVLADLLGAHYVTRPNNRDYKAGNVNHGLSHSQGEVIAVFDVDHLPSAEFLEFGLAPFHDSRVGFVQVRLSHSNADESLVAASANERNDRFFGAPMLGLNACGCAQAFGSNCFFRREALEAIGGYKPGLAEDLLTSLHLHAAGWTSRYIPLVLARGLEPVDLASFRVQQAKWANGVFSVLFSHYPGLAGQLSLGQNLGYLWRLSCYLAGPMVAGHLVVVILVLITDSGAGIAHGASYLLHGAPLIVLSWVVCVLADRGCRTTPAPSKWLSLWSLWAAYGMWPVYTAAFLRSLFGRKLAFEPTPKERSSGSLVRLFFWQLATLGLLVWSLAAYLCVASINLHAWPIIVFALLQIVMHVGACFVFGSSSLCKK